MATQPDGYEEDDHTPTIFPDDPPPRDTGSLSGTCPLVEIDGQAEAPGKKKTVTKGVPGGGSMPDKPVTLDWKGKGKDRNGSTRKTIEGSDTVASRSASACGTLGTPKI
ncbi:hypothetical protein Pmar_PMAR002633, partial [Perkinsus marinus ATCC 50983]